jgi:hypothetical protein
MFPLLPRFAAPLFPWLTCRENSLKNEKLSTERLSGRPARLVPAKVQLEKFYPRETTWNNNNREKRDD